ncbi:MAG: hypothetical protein QXH37_07500 [Candidatus Bathyarchaeia archaeon]
MGQKSCLLWARVESNIKQLIEKLAKIQGITISEYIRQLIIQDLDKRSVFTSILRQQTNRCSSQKSAASRQSPQVSRS